MADPNTGPGSPSEVWFLDPKSPYEKNTKPQEVMTGRRWGFFLLFFCSKRFCKLPELIKLTSFGESKGHVEVDEVNLG